MKENFNIDELLNAFVDQELDIRQQTEVKRLVDHDPKIAVRLDHIKKCKKLLNSLPAKSAPEHMFEDIRAALERQTLLAEPTGHREHQKGAIQLMLRKAISAAAMLALVGGLTLVILNVVMPPREPALVENNIPEVETFEPEIAAVLPVQNPRNEPKVETPVLVFNGTLEIKPEDFAVADEFVMKALADSGLAEDFQVSETIQNQKMYTVSCSHKQLNTLVKQLSRRWYQLDAARLSLAGAEPLKINSITAQQLIEIAAQKDVAKQVKAAKYYAFINNLKQPESDRVLTAKDFGHDHLDIPQPTLTSSQNNPAVKDSSKSDQQKTRLVIIMEKDI